MIISCGYTEVKVYIKPKVGVAATGNELVCVEEKKFLMVKYGIVENDCKKLKLAMVPQVLKSGDIVVI